MALPLKRDKIIRTLRQWLASGRYKPGDKFPSDQDLAQRFKVTHVTVRGALKPLVQEGLLDRRIGWGTVVRDPSAPQPETHTLATAVGVAVPDLSMSFFNDVLRAIESELHGTGHPLVLGHTWDLPAREATVLRAWFAQGLRRMIITPSGGCAAVYEELLAQGVRLVFVDRDEPNLDVAAVTSRDERSAQDVAQNLLTAAQGRVFHLAGPANVFTAKARRTGFLAALQQAGVAKRASFVLPAGFFMEDGYRATQTLLASKGPKPNALFAANDAVAVGALRALAEHGLEVPDDVRVAGYGDTDLARNFDLTSVRQFPERMGSEALRLLLSPTPVGRQAGVVLEPEVIVRGSTDLPQVALKRGQVPSVRKP